jgi:hypothetical protein
LLRVQHDGAFCYRFHALLPLLLFRKILRKGNNVAGYLV